MEGYLNSTVKTLLLWVVLIITGILLWQVVDRTQRGADKEKDFSEILSEIEKSNVSYVEITGSEVKGKFKDNSAFKTTMPNYPEFFKTLIAKGVSFKVKEPTQSPWLTALHTKQFSDRIGRMSRLYCIAADCPTSVCRTTAAANAT